MFEALDGRLHSFIAELDLDIGETKCGINHGIDYEDNPLAIDYFCQKFSMPNEEDINLRIPLCSECVASLYSEHQILFICTNCSSSQWLFRESSTRDYPPELHVLFFKRCPVCGR